MIEREIDNGTIEYVSPVRDPLERQRGYRFRCGACRWLSPIMRWPQGAERHADEHDCPDERREP